MFFGLGHPGRQMLGMSAKSKLLNSASLSLDFMTPGVLDPRITFTRASSGTYFDSAGVMQTAGYNLIRNNTQVGAIVGSPGTLPTNWIVTGSAGLTTQVIYAGADYIELRISGTPNNTLYTLNLDALTLNTGQLHTLSGYTALVGGTLTNVGSLRLIAGGSGGFNAPWNTTPTLTRVSVTWNATIAAISPQLSFNTTVSAAVDLTVRLGLAQLEQAPVMSAVPTATTGSANGAPRWDYDPSTLQLKGLLLEEQRQNLALQSGSLGTAPWTPAAVTAALPVVTSGAVIAPDGTMTGAQIVYPQVIGAGAVSYLRQAVAVTAAVHTFTVYLRGAVGGEQLYLINVDSVAVYYRIQITLTTTWQRYTLVTGTQVVGSPNFGIGTDLRDASQTTKPAQTIYAWGAQVEVGAFSTSYIPTTGAAVTRADDACTVQPANMGWFVPPGGSWFVEYDYNATTPVNGSRIVSHGTLFNNITPMHMLSGRTPSQYDGIASITSATVTLPDVVSKTATTWAVGQAKTCANGGAVASSAALTTGYGVLTSVGIRLMAMGATTGLSGHLRQMRYWARTLTDAEMQSITA